jgi:Predicted membrane protein
MSYVEKHLMPGEQIEYRANLHWLVFVLPILLFIAAIWLFSLGGTLQNFSHSFLIVGVLVTGLIAVIERRTSEFAVTNKRVLIKTGLIRRHSLETLLSKIESIGVAQSILGRILGFGTIVISGTGGSKEPFHKIADPMMFRRRVQEQIAAMEERRDTRKEG